MNPLGNMNRDNLVRDGRRFCCSLCRFVGHQNRQFDRHTERRHYCVHCGQLFREIINHQCPVRALAVGAGGGRQHNPGPFDPNSIQSQHFTFESQAHLGTIITYKHTYGQEQFVIVESAINFLYDDVVNLFQQMLIRFKNMKVLFKLTSRLIEVKKEIERIVPISSLYYDIYTTEDIATSIVSGVDEIIETLNLFCENGSGFSIDEIFSLEVSFAQLRKLKVAGFICLPSTLANKRSLLNVDTKKLENCFMISILAHFYQDEVYKPEGRSHDMQNQSEQKEFLKRKRSVDSYYPFILRAKADYNISFEGFTDGVSIQQINDFEEQNPNVSVNVYGYENEAFLPIRLTRKNAEHQIHLLLLTVTSLPPEERLQRHKKFPLDRHFVLITNINALLSPKDRNRHHCVWCLKALEKHSSHSEKCKEMHNAKIKCKEPGDRFKFNSRHMKLDSVFRIYFDLETYNKRYHSCAPQVDANKLSYTRVEANMQVAAFGIAMVNMNGDLVYQHYFAGENVMDQFFVHLFHLQEIVHKHFDENKLELEINEDTEEEFRIAQCCYECGGPFTTNNHKVRHHNHYRKERVLILCNNCNLEMEQRRLIPCLAHYGQGFDFLFIIKSLKKEMCDDVTLIQKNSEKFLSLTIGKTLRFIDSCQFLNTTLEMLVDRVKGSASDDLTQRFKCLYQGFNRHPNTNLFLKKQFFPYEWMDGPDKLLETKLPSIADFYSKLNDQHITPADYAHAQHVWTVFECKTFSDYLILYLKTDVLLLAVIYEHFVTTCMDICNLSPVYSFSLPGFAYHSALYYEKQNWEYMTDVPMIEMIRNNIRGGVCFVTKRRSTAHTETLGHVVTDPSKRSEILYLDFTNLYGSQLMQDLPHSDYRWLTEEEIAKIDIMSLPEGKGRGWVFEVDLAYDSHLHDLHNSFPMAPDHVTVDEAFLSPLQKDLAEQYSKYISNPVGKGKKLLLTFQKKEKYAVYHKLLKLYIAHGLRVTKIHRVCTFKEKPFFKNFIAEMVFLRQRATDEFTRSLYKLMINACYGKILNIQSNTTAKFCNNRQDALQFSAAHNFKSLNVINEDISIFFMEGEHVRINKPFLAGFCVLDQSKWLMYKTFYEVIVPTFKDRVTFLYGDTDSLILEIKDPNKTLRRDLNSIREHFDFSNVVDPPGAEIKLRSEENKGTPGKLKLEYDFNICEFVGLRAKSYSVLLQCKSCKAGTVEYEGAQCKDCEGKVMDAMRCKGIPRKALKKMSHATFVEALDSNEITHVTSSSIRAQSCELNVVEQRKIGLHNLDTRRFILDDNINSYAFGHWRIPALLKEREGDGESPSELVDVHECA